MTLMTHDRYCDEIAHQVAGLRELVTSGADLGAPVPTCPDWTLEQLARHAGGALRWANALVAARAQENVPREQIPLRDGPEEQGDPAALDAWLAKSADLIVGTLREAGPDAKVWSWFGDHSSGFWARRMTHEIAVHRADAALALGQPYELAAEVAADTLDEWLQMAAWLQQRRGRGTAPEPQGPARSIHLHATDTTPETNAEWIVEFGAEGVDWRRGHEKATVALRGPLTSVLLAFLRRLPLDSPELEVLGDRAVLASWLEWARF
ncbi:maleylpyruvate isomerase family mycothiol-dependent enzyme [Streptomyces sp. NPDC046805]|uniref:maleylpyruvate isomerase family mycothiol-dependent enzyme n=1 Tax=Streptomyces sp. NPDC046805 TaxID=3155134 RepID=UPI0033E30F5B